MGIRDTYYSGKDEIEGKDNARSTYKMALIKNDNFWNCAWEQYERFNPINKNEIKKEEREIQREKNKKMKFANPIDTLRNLGQKLTKKK